MAKWKIRALKTTVDVIVRAVDEFNIDVIHNHSAAGNHYCVPANFKTRVPLVSHERENWGRNWSTLGSHGWITSSPFQTGFAAGFHRACGCQGCPLLARRDGTSAGAVPPIAAPGERVYFGFGGRCWPEKGFDLVVDAALHLLPRLDFDVHIWGMGDNDYSQMLKNKIASASPEVQKRFHLQPFRSDIENFYDLIDIAVVPSRYPDPFPCAM